MSILDVLMIVSLQELLAGAEIIKTLCELREKMVSLI